MHPFSVVILTPSQSCNADCFKFLTLLDLLGLFQNNDANQYLSTYITSAVRLHKGMTCCILHWYVHHVNLGSTRVNKTLLLCIALRMYIISTVNHV